MSPRNLATAAALAAVAVASVPTRAPAWGAKTHEIINRRAALALTGPAGDAWRPLAPALGAAASVADDRKRTDPDESPRHYLDADAFDTPPFDDIPRSLAAMRRTYGTGEARSFGSAPWAIEECYRMVVLSLKRGDWSSAGAWAADLGHYVADTHQPLHCTLNYDGQRTGNHGVHLRFEIRMMDRHFREETLPAAEPRPLRDGVVVDACFAWMVQAHEGLEVLLAAETVAREADPDFGDTYHARLWEGTGEMASRQVDRAIRNLAGIYQAAWEEAGSPEGPGGTPPLAALPKEALEASPGRSSGLSRRAGAAALLILGSAWLVASR